ncbi:MAG: hypothetical protein HFH15_01135 [Ruminococcus sp.]|jgi:hypothetical protein|nr:hypothetical protein [Ruminococcus sp.]
MDSIRSNQTKDDLVTTIKLELSADIRKKKCFLLVEGNDDVIFSRKIFQKDVVCYESFSGKAGLDELIESSELGDYRVIAIKDKDYCNVEALPERMFVYDNSCLELMILKNGEVVKGLYCTYYECYAGTLPEEKIVLNAMRKLAPYSILRMKSEKQGLNINFSKVGFGDLIESEDSFRIEQLFARLNISDEMVNECKEESLDWEDELLYEITNGHDICLFLGRIFLNAGKPLGESGVRNIMLSNYRKSDFAQTKLYHQIKEYQSQYGLQYVN